MIVHIDYQSQYSYSEPVGFSSHIFRLFPKCDRYVSTRRLAFQTNLDASIKYRRDLFDNEVAVCFYPEKSALLSASLQIELELQERNAFDFLLARHAENFPFEYSEKEAQVLAPFLSQGAAGLTIPFWQPASSPQPTVSALIDLNKALHENLGYERRDEGAAYTPEETLRLGGGACRDFAVLLAAVARDHGIAARLASGYLCEFGSEEKKAEGALHAWTELYLPGAGWVAFDPTNGILCDHRHITAAVGLTPEDVSPILGFYNPFTVPSQMMASLQITPHENT